MGSFQHTTFDEIEKAPVIAELKNQTQREVLPAFNSGVHLETWSVAFAPDYSCFAWSCGNSVVKLVPWNKEKHNTRQNTATQNDDANLDNASHQLYDPFLSDNNNRRQIETIQCKDLVWSVAFGSSVPHKKLRQWSVTYRHFEYLDHECEVILAIGLKSGKIRTYNVTNGQIGQMLLLVDHKDVIRDLKFSPDGSLTLISASHDTTLKVWDLKDDGNMVVTLRGHAKWVLGCAFSPDALLLASVGVNRAVLIWDMNTYQVVRKLINHQHDVVACEFSLDGALLATASWDTRVLMWDPYTGEVLNEFSHIFPRLNPIFAGGANDHFVRDITFSPDGEHFATVCDDKLVRVWSIFDNSDPVLVSSLADCISCTFSPDGSVLAAGTRNGSVQFMAIRREIQKLQHLCRMVIRRSLKDASKIPYINIPQTLQMYIGYRNLRQVENAENT